MEEVLWFSLLSLAKYRLGDVSLLLIDNNRMLERFNEI